LHFYTFSLLLPLSLGFLASADQHIEPLLFQVFSNFTASGSLWHYHQTFAETPVIYIRVAWILHLRILVQ
jgi:hypothetical protein